MRATTENSAKPIRAGESPAPPQQGTRSAYPALQRLEAQKWIGSEWGVSPNNRTGAVLHTHSQRLLAADAGNQSLAPAGYSDLLGEVWLGLVVNLRRISKWRWTAFERKACRSMRHITMPGEISETPPLQGLSRLYRYGWTSNRERPRRTDPSTALFDSCLYLYAAVLQFV